MHARSSSSERGLPVGLRATAGGPRGRGVFNKRAAVRRGEAALSRPGKQSPRDESPSSASTSVLAEHGYPRDACAASCTRDALPVARTDSYERRTREAGLEAIALQSCSAQFVAASTARCGPAGAAGSKAACSTTHTKFGGAPFLLHPKLKTGE